MRTGRRAGSAWPSRSSRSHASAGRDWLQDEIVTRLARALTLQLFQAEASRLKRTPAGNAKAKDLALQCLGGLLKVGFLGKEADAIYRLCE
jgi:hypothetical protein